MALKIQSEFYIALFSLLKNKYYIITNVAHMYTAYYQKV